nr:hypothetical protein GCM10025699_32770 [Microbacterium flavescens]
MSMLYLDNAATTPVRPEVLEAMMPYLTQWFGNPSSHHTVGEAAADALADARARVARLLGMRAGDVIFTSGGTEANNLAVKGIALGAWQLTGRRHLVTTPIEHESILESAAYLERMHGFAVTRVPVDRQARVHPDAAADALRDDTALLTIGYANNEVGTVQDVAAIAAIARERGVPVHVDAVQAAGWRRCRLRSSGSTRSRSPGTRSGRRRAPASSPCGDASSRAAPARRRSGTGPPQRYRGRRGGGGPRDRPRAGRGRPGRGIRSCHRHPRPLRRPRARHRAVCRADRRPGAPAPGTASFTFAGTSGEAVLLELERRGVVSSSGSACAAGSDEPSHVLVAMGVDAEVARTAVRFTFPRWLRQPLDAVADAVAASVAAV